MLTIQLFLIKVVIRHDAVRKKHDAVLAAVASWFHKNKSTINATKTKHAEFGKGRNLNQLKTTINRAKNEQTGSFRYLGFISDDQLKFKGQINYVT